MILKPHIKKIYRNSTKNLQERLDAAISLTGYPCRGPNIHNLMDIVKNVKLQEFLGSQAEIGKYMESEISRTSDLLYPDLLDRLVSNLKNDLPVQRMKLDNALAILQNSDQSLQGLRNCLHVIGSARYWGGAGVIVSPHYSSKPGASDDFQVITNGDVKLAKYISWVMIQLRDATTGYVDYMSKYDFYHQIAATAKEVIERPSYEYQDIFLAAIDAAEQFTAPGPGSTVDYFEQRQQTLKHVQGIVEKHEASRGVGITGG